MSRRRKPPPPTVELGLLQHEALGVEEALRAACDPTGPELTALQAFWLVWLRDYLQGALSGGGRAGDAAR